MLAGLEQLCRAARWAIGACAAAALAAAPASAGPRRAEAESCIVYAYIDGSGQLVKTVSKGAVPAAFSASLMSYDDCEQARALAGQGGTEVKDAPPIYTASSKNKAEPRPGVAARRRSSLLGWLTGLSPWQGILLIFCWAVGLAGGIGILVTAFRTSVWWGLGCLFLPLVDLIFIILYWRSVWPSVVANLFGALGAGLALIWSAPLHV